MRIVILFVSWVCDFEILDLESRDIIHWDFKVHRNWSDLFPALGGCRLAKRNLGDHVVLDASLELFNSPLGSPFLVIKLIGLSLDALGELKCNTSGCARDRELKSYLRCEVVLRELGPNLDCEVELVL